MTGKVKRASLRWFLIILPMLPLLLFTLPRPISLFAEPTDPWYTTFTTLPTLLALQYVYPAGLIAESLGASPFTPLDTVCQLVYTGGISYFVYRLTRGENLVA